MLTRRTFRFVILCLLYVSHPAAAEGIDDSQSMHRTGEVAVPGAPYAVAISGTHAMVALSQGGLQVIDVSDPSSPFIISSVDTPGEETGRRTR
jgi:hypothetical protein